MVVENEVAPKISYPAGYPVKVQIGDTYTHGFLAEDWLEGQRKVMVRVEGAEEPRLMFGIFIDPQAAEIAKPEIKEGTRIEYDYNHRHRYGIVQFDWFGKGPIKVIMEGDPHKKVRDVAKSEVLQIFRDDEDDK